MKFVRVVIFLLTFILVSIVIFAYLVRTAKGEAACLRYDTRISQGATVWTIDPTNAKRLEHRPAAFPPINPYGGEVAEDNKTMIYLTGPKNGPYSLYVDTKPYKSKDRFVNCFGAADCWIGKHAANAQARKVMDGLSKDFMARWLDHDWLLYYFAEGDQTKVYVENVAGDTRYTFPINVRNDEGIDLNVIKQNGRIVIRVVRNNVGTVYLWSLADSRTIALQGTINGDLVSLYLSPKGTYVYRLQQDPLNKLIVLSTDGQRRWEFQLEPYMKELTYDTPFIWSLDERYLAMPYELGDPRNRNTAIFDLKQKDYAIVPGYGVWSKDGKAWIAHREPSRQESVIAYYPDQKRTVELVQKVSWLYVLGNGQIGAIVGPSGNQEFVVFNLDGTGMRTLVRAFTSISGPALFNDGDTLLYAVERGDEHTIERIDIDGTNHRVLAQNSRFHYGELVLYNNGRTFFYQMNVNGKINFGMMDIDETMPITLLEGVDFINDAMAWGNRWPLYRYDERNADILILKTIRDKKEAVEIVNLVTQRHYILRANLERIDGLHQEWDTGWIKFWWEDRDGGTGYDAYTPDGEPLYRVKVLGSDWPYSPSQTALVISPDGRLVVVRSDGDEPLQLAATDGSTTKALRLSSGRTSSYTWSHDGSRFALVYRDDSNYFIEVFDRNGAELQRFGNFIDPGNLTWTRCN